VFQVTGSWVLDCSNSEYAGVHLPEALRTARTLATEDGIARLVYDAVLDRITYRFDERGVGYKL